jgi:UPF0042 nucleotide-binding protein
MPDVLQRRYSETRRRHPLAPDDDPANGIALELDLLRRCAAGPRFSDRYQFADPHELKAEITRLFAPRAHTRLTITVMSFSYRRGLPTGADLVFDCRFLRNPALGPRPAPLDGRDAAVRDYIAARPGSRRLLGRQVNGMLDLILPAFRDEGTART